MKQQDLILVVGASGMVGSGLVELLKKEGHDVRTTTSRKPQQAGQVQVDLVTGQGIKEAFEGVTKAFLLSPPGYADQHKLLSPLIQEAKRRGLKKVVLMTAMGANAGDTPFRRAELELEKSGLNYNIIRPNWFQQNFHTFWGQGIREQNKILLPAGTAKVSFIDARDISAAAAALLTSDRFNNRDFDLTGPEAIDHAEAAAILSKATGKPVSYQEIQPEELKAGLLQAGLPKDYAELLLVLFSYLRAGYASAVNGNVESITGHKPSPLAKYAADHNAALI